MRLVQPVRSSTSEPVITQSGEATPPEKSAECATPSSYTPAVGDVVEYELGGSHYTGVVFCFGNSTLCVAPENNCNEGKIYSRAQSCNLRKIGHTHLMDTANEWVAATKAAKAYFAGEQKQVIPDSKYQVGDLVEVEPEWRVGMITAINADADYCYDVKTQEDIRCDALGWECMPNDIRPLSGTYAERQAKWVEFYDIKVGSKVKVVRSYKDKEDGFWGVTILSDAKWLNAEAVVREIKEDDVRLTMVGTDNHSFFPYFALEPVDNNPNNEY